MEHKTYYVNCYIFYKSEMIFLFIQKVRCLPGQEPFSSPCSLFILSLRLTVEAEILETSFPILFSDEVLLSLGFWPRRPKKKFSLSGVEIRLFLEIFSSLIRGSCPERSSCSRLAAFEFLAEAWRVVLYQASHNGPESQRSGLRPTKSSALLTC